jgi:hypothetical protein
MFFGPSKNNIKAAEVIDFYTKNIVGDILVDIWKNDKSVLDRLFLNGELDLKRWTNSAQLAVVVCIYSMLSNSNIKGKAKLMEVVANEVRHKSEFGLVQFTDAFSYFCSQVISLTSLKKSSDFNSKVMIILVGELVVSSIKNKNPRTLDVILEPCENIHDLFFIGNKCMVTPFLEYFT